MQLQLKLVFSGIRLDERFGHDGICACFTGTFFSGCHAVLVQERENVAIRKRWNRSPGPRSTPKQ
eukprot:4702582-Amphidinium_carterae.1